MSLRARAKNITLTKSLNQKLDHLKVAWQRTDDVVDVQLRHIRESLTPRPAVVRRRTPPVDGVRRIHSAPVTVDRTVASTPARWRCQTGRCSTALPLCRHETEPRHCRQFPCTPPATYHCIGFDIDLQARRPSKRYVRTSCVLPCVVLLHVHSVALGHFAFLTSLFFFYITHFPILSCDLPIHTVYTRLFHFQIYLFTSHFILLNS